VVHNLIARGKVAIDDKSRLYFDDKLINENGLQYEELKE